MRPELMNIANCTSENAWGDLIATQPLANHSPVFTNAFLRPTNCMNTSDINFLQKLFVSTYVFQVFLWKKKKPWKLLLFQNAPPLSFDLLLPCIVQSSGHHLTTKFQYCFLRMIFPRVSWKWIGRSSKNQNWIYLSWTAECLQWVAITSKGASRPSYEFIIDGKKEEGDYKVTHTGNPTLSVWLFHLRMQKRKFPWHDLTTSIRDNTLYNIWLYVWLREVVKGSISIAWLSENISFTDFGRPQGHEIGPGYVLSKGNYIQ